MVGKQSAKSSVHTSPRQRNSPLKKEEGKDSRIRKRSRASVAIDIESDSDSQMQKREKLVTSISLSLSLSQIHHDCTSLVS